MKEDRLRWLRHATRREESKAIIMVMPVNVGEKRGRGRPKKRRLDSVGNDMRTFKDRLYIRGGKSDQVEV
ncbi:Hypothetical protein CINCED_3A010133 [Cinara cedri]|uniref:Uncharacterized protein n=1 Tax=Cinara cedri TaxID=506608 RepID=A0A5E4M076_9HEMI|nr:Hypothetical protein CINCED_3A010133 [Cinara cedri]